MSLDYSTVHFCSSLLNVSYATMLLVLWARRGERALLYWSLSLFLAAGASYGFTLAGGPFIIAMLFGLIAFNVTLILAGARAFDGKPAFEWRMAAPPLGIVLLHASFSSAGLPLLANSLATLALGLNVLLAGRYFLVQGDGMLRFGRRIVAGALCAYIPIYVVSSTLPFLGLASQSAAIAILVGDLVLNNIFVAGLYSVIEDRSRAALRVMAETDELTGALNRGGFLKRGMHAVLPGGNACVLLADLDHFKQINDTYGHAAGDAVLSIFVARARSVIGESALIGRFGGEEFAILLAGADEQTAALHAEEIRMAMAVQPVAFNGISIRPTVSIGFAGQRHGETIEATLRRADEALYRAKNTGRNKIAA